MKLLSLLLCLSLFVFSDEITELRESALKLRKEDNNKEAYDAFVKLLRNEKNGGEKAVGDFEMARDCLNSLNRTSEYDSLRDEAIAKRPNDWQFISQLSLTEEIARYGTVVDGKFSRGAFRGRGGRHVNVYEQDRLYWLNLLEKHPPKGGEPLEKAKYIRAFRRWLVRDAISVQNYWQLQELTDLMVTPDYSLTDVRHRSFTTGVPVQADGTPVYFKEPTSWETAANDGERWRWLLKMETEQGFAAEALWVQASMASAVFGVKYNWQTNEGIITILRSLSDEETYINLATGNQRVKLPPDYNAIMLYQNLLKFSEWSIRARRELALCYEDRCQFDKAVEHWKVLAEQKEDKEQQNYAVQRINVILGNWCGFSNGRLQTAGQAAEVSLIFRNATKASFVARRLDLDQIVADTWAFIESKPKQPDWKIMRFTDLSIRLTDKKDTEKYVKEQVAAWEETLEPKDGHLDSTVTLKTPLKDAGAYLVECEVPNGNKCAIVVMLRELEAVKRSLVDGKGLWQVLDAASGEPQANATIDFLAYRQYWNNKTKKNEFHVKRFSKNADENGCVFCDESDFKNVGDGYNHVLHEVLMKVRANGKATFYGNNYEQVAWHNGRGYSRLTSRGDTVKYYLMTDRPVYRPGQKVHLKVWKARAEYGTKENTAQKVSEFAGEEFCIQINDAKGMEKIVLSGKLDDFGGVEFEMPLEKDAVLGRYSVIAMRKNKEDRWPWHIGGFRVEEYKKPEFEVKVETPEKPVALGDKIAVKVRTTYYFGAPVTEGTVSLKVTRQRQGASWCPPGRWDWFYGAGYWWHFQDYDWYPGWKRWGCPCGWLFRHGGWYGEAPEVVVQQEGELSADGTFEVTVDTAIAKELYGDSDHRYSITAEVRDKSRRTIGGTGSVTAAVKPFRAYVWLDRGYLRVGDSATAFMDARTANGRPVNGKGVLTLYKVTYDDKGEAKESAVQNWPVEATTDALLEQRFSASAPGQYLLGYALTDATGRTEEGGVVFSVVGLGDDGRAYRFNALELIPDKAEYAPGENVRLLINTERADSTVMLFVRARNGLVPRPQILRLKGKSTVVEIPVEETDKPNFFVEAYTMANGVFHSIIREIIVPPEKKILNVDVLPDKTTYKPGSKGSLQLRVTDQQGTPVKGSLVVTVYDRSLDYIAGGGVWQDIRSFFWKWKWQHYEQNGILSTCWQVFGQVFLPGMKWMPQLIRYKNRAVYYRSRANLLVEDLKESNEPVGNGMALGAALAPPMAPRMEKMAVAKRSRQMDAQDMDMDVAKEESMSNGVDAGGSEGGAGAAPATVRSNFADTALWVGAVNTDDDGKATLELPMPENLTSWKIQVWSMAYGTRVGEGTAVVMTAKDLLVRLQSPRFFVEKDEVVLSANIHNYLTSEKIVTALLELDDGCLAPLDEAKRTVKVPSKGEARIDWRVKVVKDGEAVVRMKALTDEESDAVERKFPVLVHGADKMVSVCGSIRPEQTEGRMTLEIPEQRRVDSTRMEIRWSPSLALAMLDALPYLIAYPYGCTEQTLNRFLPAVQTQQMLKRLGVSLEEIAASNANLNSQEQGDSKARKAQWKRYSDLPVFSDKEMETIVKTGVTDLLKMQCGDGGWGWFSGFGEQSWPHTTAQVVQGLLIASRRCKVNDANVEAALNGGLNWLKNYQKEQVRLLDNAAKKVEPWKERATEMDAFVYRVLSEAMALKAFDKQKGHDEMEEYLYRDKNKLSPYGKALFGLGLHYLGKEERCAELLRNIRQFVVEDNENQTAWLNVSSGLWWLWHGDEIETQAAFLKLLAEHEPKGELAPKLVKYLLNNRKNATYWRSTRDTAACLDAFATYALNSGETEPDMTVELRLDGKAVATSQITKKNLLTADLFYSLAGTDVTGGKHDVSLVKAGKGPLYYTGSVSYFSLEDFITAAGLEVKVQRHVYRLVRDDRMVSTAGSRGQVTQARAEHYRREPISNGDAVKSGELLEVELILESKNDYEYLLLEDMKAAGTEPVDIRSGYNGNELGAYVEFRDTKVSFFLRTLLRGRRSVTYRLRAEVPGKFSAIPTQISAMYAPELHGNSDELKLKIED